MPITIISATLVFAGAAVTTGGLALLETQWAKYKKRKVYRPKELKEDVGKLVAADLRRKMAAAKEMREELARVADSYEESNRKFFMRSMRAAVEPGEAFVHWVNQDGSPHRGQCIDLSMRSLAFKGPGFDADGIIRIEVPSRNLDLTVVTSSVIRKTGEDHVAVSLVEFEDDKESWMRWIELVAEI